MKPLRLVFMGTPEMAAVSLRAVAGAGHEVALVVTQPDRRAGRGRKVRRSETALAADELSLAVAQPEKVADIVPELERIAPQVLVVLAYGQLLPPAVLGAAPLGAVNVHFSLLPLLRGAAPIQRAIIDGHAETGVTTMYMDRGLDTGDIIAQQARAIAPDDTSETLGRKLAADGAALLVRTLELMARGEAPREPQDHGRATWAKRLEKGEGLVDFGRSAAEVDRQVRGMDPWPGAFARTPAGPLRFFGPTALLPGVPGAAPGELVPSPAADMLAVACGQGALGIGGVQAPGKRRMGAADYLRGSRLAPGDRLVGP